MKKYILAALLSTIGVANAASYTVNTTAQVGQNTVNRSFTLSSDDFFGDITGSYRGGNLAQDWTNLSGLIKTWDTTASFSTTQFELDGLSGSSLTTTSVLDLNYLSLHAGNNTIFFKFDSPLLAGTSFTLTTSGNGTGLSNIRGFGNVPTTQDIGLPPPPIPEPEEWAMMLLGLAFIGARKVL